MTSTAPWGTAWAASTSASAPAAWAASASGAHVVAGAEHVGHRGEGEELGAVEQAVEVGEVELVVARERHPAHLDAALGGEDVPRHDVGVVLHLGDQDRVALAQVVARPRVREQVDRLGDVLGEDDLVGAGAPRNRATLARGFVRRGGLLRDGVDAPVDVGVVGAVVLVHRVDDRGGLLRRRRGVEVDETLAVDLPFEDREVGLDARDVEVGAHQAAASRRNVSKPSASMRRASSASPVATILPSSSTETTSGVRCSRMRW